MLASREEDLGVLRLRIARVVDDLVLHPNLSPRKENVLVETRLVQVV